LDKNSISDWTQVRLAIAVFSSHYLRQFFSIFSVALLFYFFQPKMIRCIGATLSVSPQAPAFDRQREPAQDFNVRFNGMPTTFNISIIARTPPTHAHAWSMQALYPRYTDST
jgi:hypothetical protein